MTLKADYIINPSAHQTSLEAKMPRRDNGTSRVNPERYYSQGFMQREAEHLWPKVWLIAGVEADLAEVGSFFIFDIAWESIIVVRNQQGIQAYYNVCSHRGNRLVRSQRGKQNAFICPFHSWKYDIQGKLCRITDRDTFRDEVVCENPGLVEVKCEVLAGIVFINMDAEPAPLAESLGLPPGYLEAYQVDKMKVIRHVRVEWQANWKTGLDAFYETYHLHAVHPETAAVMGDLNVQYDLYDKGASRMIVPIGEQTIRRKDQDTVNEGLQFMLRDVGVDPDNFAGTAKDVRKAIQQAKRANAEKLGLDYSRLEDGQLSDSWATGVFPNVQIGLHAECIFLMRFLPHASDPERFYYDTMTLMHPVEDKQHRAPAWMGLPEATDVSGQTRPERVDIIGGDNAELGLVLSQDAELIPVVQKGLRSRGFKGPLWGEQEQRLRHFHAELDRYINVS